MNDDDYCRWLTYELQALEGKVMMQILENAQIDIGASGKMTNLFDTIAEYLESKGGRFFA